MLMFKPIFLFILMAMALFTDVYASHPNQYKVVNGIAIYLTIMPAEMLRGHPKDHLESNMHSPVRIEGTNQHHIVVSLFDAENGERLHNVRISVKVTGINFEGTARKLELMLMGGIRSYGNYFSMPKQGTYQIDLEIQKPGETEVVKVMFQYASI